MRTKHENGVPNKAIVLECLMRLRSCEKAMKSCTSHYKMLPSAKTVTMGSHNLN